MDIAGLKALINRNGEPDKTTLEVADNQDLSFEVLKNLYINHGLKINQEKFEENLGLLTHDHKYNKLAYLLSY